MHDQINVITRDLSKLQIKKFKHYYNDNDIIPKSCRSTLFP